MYMLYDSLSDSLADSLFTSLSDSVSDSKHEPMCISGLCSIKSGAALSAAASALSPLPSTPAGHTN